MDNFWTKQKNDIESIDVDDFEYDQNYKQYKENFSLVCDAFAILGYYRVRKTYIFLLLFLCPFLALLFACGILSLIQNIPSGAFACFASFVCLSCFGNVLLIELHKLNKNFTCLKQLKKIKEIFIKNRKIIDYAYFYTKPPKKPSNDVENYW